MKKKQSKKKTQNKKKKNYSETTAFANLDKTSIPLTKPKRSSSGIPKYVADRMARRIFFTAGIPTILGMSVFVVSYIIVTKNIAEIPPSSTIAISALFTKTITSSDSISAKPPMRAIDSTWNSFLALKRQYQ